MTDCILKQLSSGRWFCPVCDSDKKRTLPVKAHRNCGAAKPLPQIPDPLRLARIALCQSNSCGHYTGQCRVFAPGNCKTRWHARFACKVGCTAWHAAGLDFPDGVDDPAV